MSILETVNLRQVERRRVEEAKKTFPLIYGDYHHCLPHFRTCSSGSKITCRVSSGASLDSGS